MHRNLGIALQHMGKLDEAVACYRAALTIDPVYVQAQSNLVYVLNYMADRSPDEMLMESCRYGEIIAPHPMNNDASVYQHANEPDRTRRLRVGLVSADFDNHPVGRFLLGVLTEINTEEIELIAFAVSSRADSVTVSLKQSIPQWLQVEALSDDDLERAILAREIDVLIDLAGHTDGNKLAVFARKPAPVQVSWLGYFATTGVDAIDYVLCDKWVLPPEDEGHFIEKPWRLPDTYLCFSPPKLDVQVAELPARVNGFVTYGCFSNLTKITDSTVACWAGILRGVPGSRLFLKAKQLHTASVQDDIRSQFETHGVTADRLRLEGPSNMEAYMAAYNDVDITLDTFPYGGVTTTVESLWMGVPVLTLVGNRFISRAGESILNNMGLENWIATTPEGYLGKGIEFASDLSALSDLRQGLRDQVMTSVACDAPRFARSLEKAFRGMWQLWCDQEASIR